MLFRALISTFWIQALLACSCTEKCKSYNKVTFFEVALEEQKISSSVAHVSAGRVRREFEVTLARNLHKYEKRISDSPESRPLLERNVGFCTPQAKGFGIRQGPKLKRSASEDHNSIARLACGLSLISLMFRINE